MKKLLYIVMSCAATYSYGQTTNFSITDSDLGSPIEVGFSNNTANAPSHASSGTGTGGSGVESGLFGTGNDGSRILDADGEFMKFFFEVNTGSVTGTTSGNTDLDTIQITSFDISYRSDITTGTTNYDVIYFVNRGGSALSFNLGTVDLAATSSAFSTQTFTPSSAIKMAEGEDGNITLSSNATDLVRFDGILLNASTAVITNTTSLDKENSIVSVYPIPSLDGTITIDLSKAGESLITITDLNGVTVYSENMPGEKVLINEDMAPGTYVLHITAKTGSFTKKLIIQ